MHRRRHQERDPARPYTCTRRRHLCYISSVCKPLTRSLPVCALGCLAACLQVSVPSSCSESVLYVAPPDRVFSSLLTTLPIFFYAYCVNFQVSSPPPTIPAPPLLDCLTDASCDAPLPPSSPSLPLFPPPLPLVWVSLM